MVTEPVLQKRYRLDEPLATGGMGKVFCATDERLGRTVAVKLLRDDLSHDEKFVERFRREARASASLSHPNVAGVFDYGEDDGRHFIVMEYIEGRDLARVLREDGPLEPESAASVASQVARALEHAHAAGLVHRDVKPANVIVLPNGQVKVTDFGIARAAGDSTLTVTGSVMGTAHYISPEQAAGQPAGPASDIYSLGIVLYEMLTGAVPFTGESALSVAMRHANETVPAPSSLNPDIPPELDEVVQRATAKDPAKRYASAGAVVAALAGVGGSAAAGPGTTAILEPEEAAPTQSVWPIPGDRWDPRRVGRIVMIALAALAALAILLLLWRLIAGRDEPLRDERPQRGGATTQPEETSPVAELMPNYVGQEFKEVKEELEAQGYVVLEQKVPSGEDKDIVVGTNPEAETPLTPGQEIQVFVSDGEGDGEGEGEDEGEGNGDEGKGNDKGKGKGKDD